MRFKNHLYYEERDDVKAITKALSPLAGSKITFFKNGVSQGVAYTDLYEGTYLPGVSVFKNTCVTVNFGPNFKHPPPVDKFNYKAMHLRAEETIIEQAMADMLYLTENSGKLTLDLP